MKQKKGKLILVFIILCFQTSLISQSIAQTSKKNSPTKLVENSEGRLPNDEEVILRKAGIIISLNATIYSQPNYNSSIINSVEIGDVFFVQDIIQTLVHRNQYYKDEWYQIVFPDYSLGWVNIKDFKISEIKGIAPNNPFDYHYKVDDSKKLISVIAKKINRVNGEFQSSYQIGKLESEGWDEFYVNGRAWVNSVNFKSLVDIYISRTQNEVCLNFLWEKVEQDNNFDEEHSYNVIKVTKKDILYKLTEEHRRKKNYDKAIEYQKICMQHYPDSSSPYRVIGNIYWYSLNNIHDALDFLFQIYQNFPEKEIRYYEGHSTVHYEAFVDIQRIINDSNLDNESSLYYYQKVIELTDSPSAHVLAVLERAKILRNQQKFELALTELNSCLEKYPALYHSFFKYGVYYSFYILSAIFDLTFYDLNNPKEALDFCVTTRLLYTDNSLNARQNNLFKAGISFFEAKISDETNGDRDYVINLYDRLTIQRIFCSSLSYNRSLLDIIRNRLQSINSFNIRDGEIKFENTIVYESPDSLSKTIYSLKLVENVTVLYPLVVKKKNWYKIKTSENIIGWIQDDFIQLGEEQIIEQEVVEEENEVTKKTVELQTIQEKAQANVVEKKTVKNISKINLSLIYAIVSISIVILFAIILIVAISKRRN